MEDNNEVLETADELSDELADVFDEAWDDADDDFTADEGSDSDDGPISDDEPEEHEEGQPDADHDSENTDESAEATEEPGAEDEEGNQLFEINYLGNKERLTRDQITELAQKGRDYDHVREERDDLRGKAGRYESFLQKLADRAGVSIEDQIDLTEAMWLMDEEAEKGNSLTEAEALLRVQRMRNEPPKEAVPEQSKSDYEVSRFMEAYPDVRSENIPREVWDEVDKNGGDLLGAYRAYEIKTLKAENEKLKQNAQNERNTQRSAGPRKTSGANTHKRDAFDEGWDSEF